MAVLLGAIADDFTGATDLANTLVGQGMHAVQVIGVPGSPVDLGDAEAVVVALKSRTTPVANAVADSLAALAWLREQGAEQIFFKYCSTFDSTAEGNIGPVADALLDALDDDRSVYMGHLFVGGLLLEESSMKDHPLTPMNDSQLVRLMAAQSKKRVGLLPYPAVSAGVEATRVAIAGLRDEGVGYGGHPLRGGRCIDRRRPADSRRCRDRSPVGHWRLRTGARPAGQLPSPRPARRALARGPAGHERSGPGARRELLSGNPRPGRPRTRGLAEPQARRRQARGR
jgi:hypothetical protein